MVKQIVTGIWVLLVTLAAVYFSVQMATKPPATADDSKKVQLELVRGESISVPTVRDGKVTGYFLNKLSFMVDKAKNKPDGLPFTTATTDLLFSLLMNNPVVDPTNPKAFDIEAFRKQIKEGLNKAMGADTIAEVYIEQLDYLSKDDLKASTDTGKPMKPAKIATGETPPGAEVPGTAEAKKE